MQPLLLTLFVFQHGQSGALGTVRLLVEEAFVSRIVHVLQQILLLLTSRLLLPLQTRRSPVLSSARVIAVDILIVHLDPTTAYNYGYISMYNTYDVDVDMM